MVDRSKVSTASKVATGVVVAAVVGKMVYDFFKKPSAQAEELVSIREDDDCEKETAEHDLVGAEEEKKDDV